MGTVAITNFTGALEGVAGTDYRLINAGDKASAPWNQVTSGCVFRLPFNSTFNDAAGGLTPTVIGDPARTASWLDNFGDFDGNDALQFVASSLTGISTTKDWSMSFWVKSNATFAAPVSLQASDAATNTFASGFRIHLPQTPTPGIAFIFYNGSADTIALLARNVSDGNWHPVLCTYAGSTSKLMSIYADAPGNVATKTYASIGWTAGATLQIGRRLWSSNPAYLTGGLDDVCLMTGVLSTDDWKRTRYNATSLRTSATGTQNTDSTVAGAVWSSLNITIGAVTSNESYAVYFAPSDSVTVPAAGSGLWQLVGSGYTTSQVLDVSGLAVKTGRYGHTRVVVGTSTDAVQQYAVEWDGWTGTYASPLDYGVVLPGRVGAPIQAGRVVTFPNAGAVSYPFDIKQGEH